jgi:hypothetical protein
VDGAALPCQSAPTSRTVRQITETPRSPSGGLAHPIDRRFVATAWIASPLSSNALPKQP